MAANKNGIKNILNNYEVVAKNCPLQTSYLL